jgi:thiol:disulfide interchange protein DsbD
MFSFSLGLGVLFFIAGTFAVNLPKGGAWMMGIKWASGVGLAYMAFAYIRDSQPALAKKVILPSAVFGVGVGALFLVGLGLGIVHVLAERRKSPIAHLSRPMKLASIVPAVAGAFLFLSWLNTSKPLEVDPNAPKIEWAQKEAAETVLAKAGTDKKPVMIDFGASWCKACMELEEQTFPDARVRTEASRYLAIHVDATDDDDENVKKLQGKYKVRGLPTVILLDSAGAEQTRFTEFVEPGKFVEALRKVK